MNANDDENDHGVTAHCHCAFSPEFPWLVLGRLTYQLPMKFFRDNQAPGSGPLS